MRKRGLYAAPLLRREHPVVPLSREMFSGSPLLPQGTRIGAALEGIPIRITPAPAGNTTKFSFTE